ncbi:MAG: serine hydrolase [Clostridiales bacterium]|nr:serine hydrolase [Clostridiales bacterium]
MRNYPIYITKGEVPFSPQEAGYEKERLSVLDQHLKNLISKDMIQSASYCLARDNKTFVHKALGYLNYKEEDGRPFLPDSVYGIYSITKLVTAVAILQLVEDGILRLDQPVGEILEEFKDAPFDKIQVWHLLTHTSGLYCDEGCKPDKYHESTNQLMKSTNWINRLLSKGLSSEPGNEWAYSSLGYNVLGEIITRSTGVFAHDYINERVLKVCDMQDTHWVYTTKYKERYSSRFDWMDWYIEQADQNLERKANKVPRTWNGLLSTDADLMKFGTMLLNYGKYNGKHVLGRKAVEALKRNQIPADVKNFCWGANGANNPYGLGPTFQAETNRSQLVTPGTINHEGWGTSCLMIDYEEKFVAVWSAQFVGDNWSMLPLRNVASIIWSGII